MPMNFALDHYVDQQGLFFESEKDCEPMPIILSSEIQEEIKNNLVLERTGWSIKIYIIAIAKNGENTMKRIDCNKSKPIGNHCYDMNSDQLIIECAAHLYLGEINLGCKLSMKNILGWNVDVPLPESFILKKLNDIYRGKLEVFEKEYPEDKYVLSFAQIGGVYY